MSDLDLHLKRAQAAAQERETRIRQLEQKLEATGAEHDNTVRQLEARHDRLRTQKKKRLTDDNLRGRHVQLKRDIHELRADAQLAGDEKLLRKIQGLDQPANPYIERERELDQREAALEAAKSKPRKGLFSK